MADINLEIADAQPINIAIAGYSGDTDIYSNPPSGCYRIYNIYLNASLEVVIVYEDVAES